MIVDRACQWWLIHRYWPHREAVLNADPRWVELRALQAAALGRDQPLEEWVRMILEQGAIQRRLFPVEPWAELLGLHRKELCALYESRAGRRTQVLGLRRAWVGEHLWAAGSRVAATTAGTVVLLRRVAQDRSYTGMEWSGWEEVLADQEGFGDDSTVGSDSVEDDQ